MAKTAAALHILVKEEKLALDLLEQLKNGADFGKLAKKHSICPSGKRGGDLGEYGRRRVKNRGHFPLHPALRWRNGDRSWTR